MENYHPAIDENTASSKIFKKFAETNFNYEGAPIQIDRLFHSF